MRTVEYFTVERNEEEILFIVKADGFLYNMVRIMAGTLLEIAEGKIPQDSQKALLHCLKYYWLFLLCCRLCL